MLLLGASSLSLGLPTVVEILVEGIEEEEQTEEVEEVGVRESGVGAWLAPPRKKLVKKSFFKKTKAGLLRRA